MKENPLIIAFNQTTEAICDIIRNLITLTEEGERQLNLINLNETIKKNGKQSGRNLRSKVPNGFVIGGPKL